MKNLFWNIVESMNAKWAPFEGIQTLWRFLRFDHHKIIIWSRCLVYIREFSVSFINCTNNLRSSKLFGIIVSNKIVWLKCIDRHFIRIYIKARIPFKIVLPDTASEFSIKKHSKLMQIQFISRKLTISHLKSLTSIIQSSRKIITYIHLRFAMSDYYYYCYYWFFTLRHIA